MEIGGYFELEFRKGKEYHTGAKQLNSGRNALEYILRSKSYRKIYLPFFFCDVLLEPVIKLGIDYEFYSIDSSFYPVFDFSKVEDYAVLVYINYFGICSNQVNFTIEHCKNIIIDNSQAFFSKPKQAIDTFYSPRKFFGVPDGAYLYTNQPSDIELEQDTSIERIDHLIGRIESNAETFYPAFRQNNSALKNQQIKKMSLFTQKILQGIDYNLIKETRVINFDYLHKELSKTNQLKINLSIEDSPMVYPYMQEKEGLRGSLIQNKIYVAQYWPNVLNQCNKNTLEYCFANNIIPLPIDQRYNLKDMKYLIDKINLNNSDLL